MDFFPSDITMVDLLRKQRSMSVADLSQAMEVTATAVRQRLVRLMGQGFVVRSTEPATRGRPAHLYELTAKGRNKAGANFADLAIVLWEEIRQIKDPAVRRGLTQRVATRMAQIFSDDLQGGSLEERLEAIAQLFGERNIPVTVDYSDQLPILTALACPYPELAEQDRGVCAMEQQMISELAGESMRLTNCRLDGDQSCTFIPRKSNGNHTLLLSIEGEPTTT